MFIDCESERSPQFTRAAKYCVNLRDSPEHTKFTQVCTQQVQIM